MDNTKHLTPCRRCCPLREPCLFKVDMQRHRVNQMKQHLSHLHFFFPELVLRRLVTLNGSPSRCDRKVVEKKKETAGFPFITSSKIEMPRVHFRLNIIFLLCIFPPLLPSSETHTRTHANTLNSVATGRREGGGGDGGLIGLAPLFHLTEQKGSRLCQTASRSGKRESASRAYVCSVSTGRYRHGQALSSSPQPYKQSSENKLHGGFEA